MPRRKRKQYTVAESAKILNKIFSKPEEEFLSFKNHMIHPLKPNTFRFTINIMSLEILIALMELKEVKNVYFNPSVPPPGSGIDSISMRYKVYVEYHPRS